MPIWREEFTAAMAAMQQRLDDTTQAARQHHEATMRMNEMLNASITK